MVVRGRFARTREFILKLPADSRIVGAVAFGIPDENPSQPAKKPINDIVHFDKW